MSVPMPPDLRIVPPKPDIDPAFARFSGAWGNGAWSGIGPVALAVERVGRDGATDVVYSYGACPQFGFEPHWNRRRGLIMEGRLRLDTAPGFLTEFTIRDDGLLVGRFIPPEGYQARVWLDRVPGRTAEAVASTLALPRRLPWKELRIPVRSAVGATTGRTLQLQAFHYPTRLPGRQPLVVLNYGSTDGETTGVPCIHPFEPEGRLFLARGCSVLALMRKGRGCSEGPVLEEVGGNEVEQDQVDSGVEDIHAAVSFLREQAHVDASRVIVGGQSRGGLLSMAYAGRHPGHVAGVLNFAGGWWGEDCDRNGFNREQATRAGAGAAAPMLWLYGERDSFYGIPFVRGLFEAFRAAGGSGALLTFDDLPCDGHQLMTWHDRWETTGPIGWMASATAWPNRRGFPKRRRARGPGRRRRATARDRPRSAAGRSRLGAPGATASWPFCPTPASPGSPSAWRRPSASVTKMRCSRSSGRGAPSACRRCSPAVSTAGRCARRCLER